MEEIISDSLLRLVEWCLRHRGWVISLTLATMILAIFGFLFVPQQFFPSSSRPELLVDLRLPEGSSFAATETEKDQAFGGIIITEKWYRQCRKLCRWWFTSFI